MQTRLLAGDMYIMMVSSNSVHIFSDCEQKGSHVRFDSKEEGAEPAIAHTVNEGAHL